MKAMLCLGEYVEVRTEAIDCTDAGRVAALSNGRYRISIDINMPKAKQQEALLHETIHLLSAELGLGLTEEQVRPLSRVLYSMGVKPPKVQEVED